MVVVDSCGWLEWFTDGALADEYRPYLEDIDDLIVPSIVLYEVYKFLKREAGEEKALLATGYIKNARIIPLDDILALKAADIALEHRIAMADAIVAATAEMHDSVLITSDADLKDLANVKFLPKRQ